MSGKTTPPRAERIAEFFDRLKAAPLCETMDEAFDLVSVTLNAVEDELTNIPYNQEKSESYGRLYPPLREKLREMKDYKGVKRHRHRFHITYFGKNGSIEIRESRTNSVVLEKPGRDGKGVWQ